MSRPPEILSDEIRKYGVISFARFMELALYCPLYGYYEAEKDTLGRGGDFFTSVSVGSLFGELLAFQFSAWLEDLRQERRDLQIVEGGAHWGMLAGDILAWLKARRPNLCDGLQYIIIEPSARRQARQKQSLGEFAGVVRWVRCLEEMADPGVCGIIFSNELLDAMPVHRLGWNRAAGQWFEWGVTLKDGKFVWSKMNAWEGGGSVSAVQSPKSKAQGPSSELVGGTVLPDLPAALREVLPDGFTTEICPGAVQWWSEAARLLRRGKLVTLDYGLTEEEVFSPERKEGTLRAYSGHRLSGDVLAQPGEQDLTAHVHFTPIQLAGEAAGLATEQFITQEQFLMRLVERLLQEQPNSMDWTSRRTRELQTLTHPEQLGRRFRVLVQSRD